MPSTSAPFGLRPINHPSGVVRPKRLVNGLASGYATALYKGTPIAMNTSGNLIIATATNDLIGVFWGVEFTLAGKRYTQSYWPASTVPDTTGEPFYVYYFDDPFITYEVQADGALAQTAIGAQSDLSNITAGSSVTQISGATISATPEAAAAQGQFRIEDISPYPNNAWSDTYTIVQGKIAQHQYIANKVGI
jgi:hypothetical protein